MVKSFLKKNGIKIILLVLFLIIMVQVINQDNKYPQIVGGQVDLKNWNFNEDGIVPLSGEWEFHWMKLIHHDEDIEPTTLMQVPSTWEKYFPSFGYATYKVSVTNTNSKEPLAIYLTNAATAYKLYVNGEFVGSNGYFSNNKNDFKPQYCPKVLEIGNSKNNEIILQVANYIYDRGGLWFTPYLGNLKDIEKYSRGIGYKDLFLLGGLFMIALYHLIIYTFNRNLKEYLFFAIVCFVVSLRIMVYGSYFIFTLIPNIPYKVVVLIIYMSLIWVPTVFLRMVREVFCEEKMSASMRFIIGYSLLASLFILFIPIKIFTGFATFFSIIAFIIEVYTIWIVLKAIKNKQKGAKILLLGTIILLFGLIYDVLFHKNYIFTKFGMIAPLTYFLFALIISVLLAKRYSDTFKEIENLNKELKEVDVLKNQMLDMKLAFLQAQIKPHFLFNALNVIATLCILEPSKARDLILELAKYLHHSFNFNKFSHYISFKEELEFVKAYVNIEKARFRDKLNVIYEIDDINGLQVPPLIIQPIVENAIRHGIRKKVKGGSVIIRVKNEENKYLLEVLDNGIGMTEEKINNILDEDRNEGVGLPNINGRLKEIYGIGLKIESKIDEGTLVSVTIPKSKGDK